MSSSRKIKVDGAMDLSQAIAHLESALASLKDGAIRVQAGREELTLRPAGRVDFEMQVSQKKDKEKFSLEISWKYDEAACGRDIKISS